MTNSLFYAILVIGVLALIYQASSLSARTYGLMGGNARPAAMTADELPKPASEGFASSAPVGVATNVVANKHAVDPADMLPNPQAAKWNNEVNPADLLAGNFLDPGRMTGVNQITRFKTVPNLQLRSDPVITTKFDSPYNRTPDLIANTRPEFEIGRRPDYQSLQGESTGRS